MESSDAPILLPARQSFAVAGEPSADLFEVIEGWVLRGSAVIDGRCQVTAIYLPGDLCDPLWLHRRPSQNYWTASPATLQPVPIVAARFGQKRRPHRAVDGQSGVSP